MHTKTVHSYGIIPIKQTESGLEVLVIHMYGSAGGTHWTFPKGRPEPDETSLQSALRECKEEVGITPTEVWEDTPLTQTYSFTHDDAVVNKTVTYFIGIVTSDTVTIQPEEIVEAVWLPVGDVANRLTHDSSKEVFMLAKNLIEEHGLLT